MQELSKPNDHWKTGDVYAVNDAGGHTKVWSRAPTRNTIVFSSLKASERSSEEFNDGNAMMIHKKSMMRHNDQSRMYHLHYHFIDDESHHMDAYFVRLCVWL